MKLPILLNVAVCTVVGFNGIDDAQATMCKNVSFEIPGCLQTEIDLWYCQGAENIIGTDILSQRGWIIVLANRLMWKGLVNRKPVVIDQADYCEFGSICLTEAMDTDYKNRQIQEIIWS